MAEAVLNAALPDDDQLPPWRKPGWQEDPQDILDARLQQLRGLANCVAVLGRADRTTAVGEELIDDALPMLGWVMQELSMDAIRAVDAIARRKAVTGAP